MLVLSRHRDEEIFITVPLTQELLEEVGTSNDLRIKVAVVAVCGPKVRLGIQAHPLITIDRAEVTARKSAQAAGDRA